jgi:hypothetical protein
MAFSYTTILSAETVGDSLTAVNANYLNLDVWTQNITLSTEVIWKPLVDFYKFYENDWNNTITLVREYSAKWISYTSLVETNSARWIEPITIFYPGLFPQPFTPDDLIKVQEFLETKFPIYSGRGDYPGVYGNFIDLPPGSIVTTDYVDTDQDFIDDRYQLYPGAPANNKNIPAFNAKPNYVENQIAIIYALTYTINKDVIKVEDFLRDFTICTTNPRDVCVYCETFLTGGGPCGWGYFRCPRSGRGCRVCKKADCFYSTPPYKRLDDARSEGFIEANVYMNYTEQKESTEIVATVFKVVDCNWTFDRFILA